MGLAELVRAHPTRSRIAAEQETNRESAAIVLFTLQLGLIVLRDRKAITRVHNLPVKVHATTALFHIQGRTCGGRPFLLFCRPFKQWMLQAKSV